MGTARRSRPDHGPGLPALTARGTGGSLGSGVTGSIPPAPGPSLDLDVQPARTDDVPACIDLAEAVTGPRGAAAAVETALARGHLLVARAAGEVVGVLAYRTDWFGCTLVTLVSVRAEHRRRGIARRLFAAVEDQSPGPRLFSTVVETNVAGIRLHRALGFVPSGHLDNLPQGYRELVFYKRLR